MTESEFDEMLAQKLRDGEGSMKGLTEHDVEGMARSAYIMWCKDRSVEPAKWYLGEKTDQALWCRIVKMILLDLDAFRSPSFGEGYTDPVIEIYNTMRQGK